MGLKHQARIEKLNWKQARAAVSKVHPKLCKIIDELNPSDGFALYKAYYPFGAKILQAGTLYLPSDSGRVVPINSSFISSSMQEDFKRRSAPLSLVIKNCNEVFYEMPDRVICLNLFKPGYIFGLWEHLDPQQSYYVKCLWTIVAGARSLYLLPKITDVESHKVLRKKYGVHARIPKTFTEEWPVLTQITNSQHFDDEWYSEILFFSDKWMEIAVKDPAWKDFYNFMLQDGWDQSQYWRNKVTFDIVWEFFINQLKEQNLKPNPYLVHIVKHIVLVGTGVLPAFAPAIDDSCAPVESLQKVFINDYKLRDYIPTIMQPAVFDLDVKNNSQYVYYSMQQPTLLETSLASKHLQSILKAMPEIAYLVDSFNIEVEDGTIKATDTPIETFTKKVVCDYFHNEANKNTEGVKHTREMPKVDKALVHLPKGCNSRVFAETSRFLKGCVRFSLKEKSD